MGVAIQLNNDLSFARDLFVCPGSRRFARDDALMAPNLCAGEHLLYGIGVAGGAFAFDFFLALFSAFFLAFFFALEAFLSFFALAGFAGVGRTSGFTIILKG